ncbi:MAG TPA: iron-sulfur cluster repair di-iron protein [Ilumatobacter sp.]|nr:iron-sulfur cluster repair di-iron protein [Ilumatobacter sp.]
MNTITSDSTLAELVIARPGLARRFDELGLDYCCGGASTLADAADAAGLDVAETLADLERVPTTAGSEPHWSDVGELVDWIEATHHAFLHDSLPRLTMLADKVAGVHRVNHPELTEVAILVHEIRADLEPHLRKEEMVLFPMVRELAAAVSAPTFQCGTLANPIRVMLSEHDSVGDLLARLRSATRGYVVPEDGCGSYHALYAGLAELEADTHRHVHLENNVLFPAVLAAEDGFAADTTVPADDQGGEGPCWAHLFDES